MIRRFACAALLGLLSPLALAQGGLMVDQAYVRAMPPGTPNTAAYMRLMNHSDDTLVLTGAFTPVAGRVMIHESSERDGMMRMDHRDSITIPPHGTVEFKSGGLHLMLMDLHAPLAEDQPVELTLEFEGGLSRALSLPVRREGGQRPMDSGEHGAHSQHDAH